MWFIVAGLAISAIGWGLLIWGITVETSSSLFARPEATAHTIAMVTNLIHFGYALCIFGAIWDLPKRMLTTRTSSDTDKRDAESEGDETRAAQPATSDAQAAATDWSHVEHEFKKAFGVLAKVHPNGRVTLARGTEKLHFEDVQQAWEHCLRATRR